MRLPRDVASDDLILRLARLGYSPTHQTGSHVRLTTHARGQHHLTIPAHDPIKVGTLNAILRDAPMHAGVDRSELLRILFS